jgi:hypothetical protein
MSLELLFGLVMVALVVGLVVLGVVFRGSDGDLLDWRPERLTRRRDLDAQDTAEMLVATDDYRRRHQPDANEPFDFDEDSLRP